MKLILLALVLAVVSAPAFSFGAPLSPPSFPTPAAPDSQCSNLTAGPDGTLHLTYYGPAPAGSAAGARTLYLATLAPKAAAFSAPRPIVTTPSLMENWADFASLAVCTDGALTAQWFQTDDSGGRHSYSGWCARSTDGGATWSAPTPLGHEFVALAPLSGGRTLAVWLESTRKHSAHASSKKAPAPASGAQPPAPDSQLPYSPSMKLTARLLAADGANLGEWTVDPDVCTCCQNTVAVLPGDRVFTAYRGHTPEEIRDNKFSIFDLNARAWSAPATLKDDHWKIPACPVNGPAADARGSAVAVAWFTAADGVARVQTRTSADAGETFSTPAIVDLGRPMGRIETVMLLDHSALILWLEMKSEKNAAGIYARRLFADGTLSAPMLVADTTQARASGFPRAALRPNGRVLMSWTQTGEPNQVRVLELDPTQLPPAPAGVQTLLRASRRGPASLATVEFCVAPVAGAH